MNEHDDADAARPQTVASPLRPSNVRIESDDDLFLIRLLMGAQPTLVMVAAAEAGFFDCIGTGALTAAAVAAATDRDARATRLVLDSLVGLGVLTKTEDHYSNSPTSLRHLRIDTAQSHAVRLWIAGTRQWERLPDILRTGKLPDAVAEVDAWRRDDTENAAFIRTMYDIGWMTAQAVADAIDLAGVHHMADLGGGPGHYAIAMLERAPHLRATVIDLPLALAVARDALHRRRLAGRAELLACDLFAPGAQIPVAPRSVQLVLISHMLHMEGPMQNAGLIAKAAQLLTPGGKLIIHDMFLEENRTDPQLSSLCAVHMLAMSQRGELYPASVLIGWLAAAGLHARILATAPFLIEGIRPA